MRAGTLLNITGLYPLSLRPDSCYGTRDRFVVQQARRLSCVRICAVYPLRPREGCVRGRLLGCRVARKDLQVVEIAVRRTTRAPAWRIKSTRSRQRRHSTR